MTIDRETRVQTAERKVVNSSRMDVVRVDETEDLAAQRMVHYMLQTEFSRAAESAPERDRRLKYHQDRSMNAQVKTSGS